jgi:putative membrane protein
MRIYLILALVLAIIVTIFAVQNIDPVNVSFLTFELNGSLALVLLITLTVGIIIGILVSAPSSLRRRMEISGLRKNMRKMEKDLTAVRESTTVPPASQVKNQASGKPPAEEITEGKSEA